MINNNGNKPDGQKSSHKTLYICIAIVVIGIGSLTGYLFAQNSKADIVAGSGKTETTETGSDNDLGSNVIYNGREYTLNRALDAVLFLGIDAAGSAKINNEIGQNGRSDTIVLFILDNDKKQTTMLEISRDTMVDIDVYDYDGDYLYTAREQLTMQYAYGTDAKNGCRLTSNKVSKLLYDLKIDASMSLIMDGIKPAVDAVGGIAVKIPFDSTEIDPSYTEGATVDMDGAAAMKYVRWRAADEAASNTDRMARQISFFKALYSKIQPEGTAAAETLQNAMGEYLYGSLDAETIAHLFQYKLSDTVITVPGENVSGDLHDEFHVDQDGLKELVLELFYTAV